MANSTFKIVHEDGTEETVNGSKIKAEPGLVIIYEVKNNVNAPTAVITRPVTIIVD